MERVELSVISEKVWHFSRRGTGYFKKKILQATSGQLSTGKRTQKASVVNYSKSLTMQRCNCKCMGRYYDRSPGGMLVVVAVSVWWLDLSVGWTTGAPARAAGSFSVYAGCWKFTERERTSHLPRRINTLETRGRKGAPGWAEKKPSFWSTDTVTMFSIPGSETEYPEANGVKVSLSTEDSRNTRMPKMISPLLYTGRTDV